MLTVGKIIYHVLISKTQNKLKSSLSDYKIINWITIIFLLFYRWSIQFSIWFRKTSIRRLSFICGRRFWICEGDDGKTWKGKFKSNISEINSYINKKIDNYLIAKRLFSNLYVLALHERQRSDCEGHIWTRRHHAIDFWSMQSFNCDHLSNVFEESFERILSKVCAGSRNRYLIEFYSS